MGKMSAHMEAEIDDAVLEKLFGALTAKGVNKIIMEIKDVEGKLIITAEPSEESVVEVKKAQ
ncbi:hypothetical protein EYM_04380 [Ignicoccus islandicus DSM 13165]|uniref:Uncharacterized protein n=1 Tax=Ignicoccus islandicus DSM 13165 TaxID=940295 RepID=A0A0U3FKX8_9CREN|nr:hypothetical protein [Ignicoccus islandicus]ALU12486.1 hypothetical protein EYM_04380 [Ignicoccus islandicus DSM 13165]